MGGIECAIFNTVSEKDKVLVPVAGTFSKRMAEIARIAGANVVELPIQLGKAITPEKLKEALDIEKPKIVCIVANETSTGAKIQELQKIGKIIDGHEAILIVDAVSMLGGDELLVDKWKIDICVAASQKCLACPPGVAIISVNEKAWEKIKKTERKSFYFDLLRYKKYFEEKKEIPFTPALPLFFALEEGIKMIMEEGLKKRIERHKICAKAFYKAIEKIKLSFFPEKKFRSVTTIAVNNPKGITDEKIRKIMKEKYGVVIAGGMGETAGKIFRIGNMGIVSKKEVIYTIAALENTLKELGHEVENGVGITTAEKVFSNKLSNTPQ
jgi:aspartate aminotransferase-like enzyme